MDVTERHPRALGVPARPSGLTLGYPGDQTWVVGSAVTTP